MTCEHKHFPSDKRTYDNGLVVHCYECGAGFDKSGTTYRWVHGLEPIDEPSIRAELDTLKTQLADAKEELAEAVHFASYKVNQELQAQLASVTAERDKLREELDYATKPSDPLCASDAADDTTYWRMKAREHWDAYRGVSEEKDEQAEAYQAQLASVTRRLDELREAAEDVRRLLPTGCVGEKTLRAAIERMEAEREEHWRKHFEQKRKRMKRDRKQGGGGR